MFDSLGLFEMAQMSARHAAERQVLAARNTANADTPGYRAMDIPDFAELVSQAPAGGLKRSRPGHILGAADGQPDWARLAFEARTRGAASPNGNTVSLETEMLRSVEAERQHNRATAIYRHGLTVLRTALGR